MHSQANEPLNGSCIPKIYGCANKSEYNFDPKSNTANGTCNETGLQHISVCAAGSCVRRANGCTNPVDFNFDTHANTHLSPGTNDTVCLEAHKANMVVAVGRFGNELSWWLYSPNGAPARPNRVSV